MTKKTRSEPSASPSFTARLRISISTEIDVRVTRAWFDEISESVPLDEADLPCAVQEQIDHGSLLDHVVGVEVVEIVDASDEARARRRAERRASKKAEKGRARAR